ncbi:YqjF family protein [Chthoniobacter flavus]
MPATLPQPRVFLTAEWRSLLMVNYVMDPAVLRPLVPRGVELDLWQGEALVSMVGFLFLDTRVLGVPIPFHRDFEEVNLRFYVRRETPEGWRRGVIFVREIVPRWAIASLARGLYNEPYLACPMRHHLTAGTCEYGWHFAGRWNSLSAEFRGEPVLLGEGSAEEFIFEHYWGYTRLRDGSTAEYQVEHPRWRAWTAENPRLEGDMTALYGAEFAQALGRAPVSAFLAEGSAISVRKGAGVRGGGGGTSNIERPTVSTSSRS